MTESALEQRGSRLKVHLRPLGPWGGVWGGGFDQRSACSVILVSFDILDLYLRYRSTDQGCQRERGVTIKNKIIKNCILLGLDPAFEDKEG